jgi:hypothetical protein
VWRLDKVIGTLAKSGFEIDGNIEVQNTTPPASEDENHNSGFNYYTFQGVQMGTFSSWQQDDDLYVQFDGRSVYHAFAVMGYVTNSSSICWSSYVVTISVSGPRGVPLPSL